MRSTIAIATVAAAAGTALASDNCRNFLASCDGIDLQFYGDRADQPWLHAGGGCGDGSGGRAYGFLELNKKFTNSFGNLQFKEDGGFGYSCSNIRYQDGTLYARCGNGNGGVTDASINLNDYICNVWGQMEAF